MVGVMREGFEFRLARVAAARDRCSIDSRAPSRDYRLCPARPRRNRRTAQAELTTAGRRRDGVYPPRIGISSPPARPYADDGRAWCPRRPADRGYSTFSPSCCDPDLRQRRPAARARAASREADLVVRTALGASRGRIVVQMFAEALVLGRCRGDRGRHRCRHCASHLGRMFSRPTWAACPSGSISSFPRAFAVAIVLTVACAAAIGHHAGDEDHAWHGRSAQTDHGRRRWPAIRRRMDRGDRGAGRGHGDVPAVVYMEQFLASRSGLRSRIRERAISRRADRTGLPGRWRLERRRRHARAQRAAGRHARRASPEGGRAARRAA